ncbi:hypothetical protein AQUSIP_12910 [Aquicella siphonis]|uniref:Uncharacterized protein n=1 Tax=Aquicella siphonis TaxID=254247 RepID=A0A5E4PG53_9COXI|nr:hypothetical protein [Aquicella siphonis]VVC75990.1 hypothetical protein AQUSIP_12910 [Aquicella siphonis]
MNAKVTLQQTPSEKIINKQQREFIGEVVDDEGKVYKLRIPDPCDEFDLTAALGKDAGMNTALQARALPLIWIESIDGTPFTRPGSYNEIRAALKRVGNSGMRVIMEAMQRYYESINLGSEENVEQLKK